MIGKMQLVIIKHILSHLMADLQLEDFSFAIHLQQEPANEQELI